MEAETLEMTQAEYARHRGVTRQAIKNLCDKQKIPFRKEGGSVLIDVAAADRALGETRERITVAREEDEPGLPPGASAQLTKAKTATEVYRARTAQLEFEERIGKLVPAQQVTDAAVVCAENLLTILNRVSQHAEPLALAAKKNGAAGVRDALKEIVRDVRTQAAREFEKLATAAMKAKQPASPTEAE